MERGATSIAGGEAPKMFTFCLPESPFCILSLRTRGG
jgi:hypothetical protein